MGVESRAYVSWEFIGIGLCSGVEETKKWADLMVDDVECLSECFDSRLEGMKF